MNLFKKIFIGLFLFTLFVGRIIPQNSKNISLLGGYSEGPCYANALQDSTIFLGNGTGIDVITFNASGITEKKTRFETKYLINYLKIKNNVLFAATDGGLFLIDVSNSNSPVQLSNFLTEGKCKSFFIRNDLVYIVDDARGFHIIDIRNINKPILVSTFTPESTINLTQVCATDTIAYLCDSKGQLLIVNTKVKARPVLVSPYKFSDSHYPVAITLKDNYAYVAAVYHGQMQGLGQLFVFDISNPITPKPVSSIYTPGDWFSCGRDAVIRDSLLFLSYYSDVQDGVEVYDISKPESIKAVDGVNDGKNDIRTSASFFSSVSQKYLVLSMDGNGLAVFSIANLRSIKQILTYKTCDTVNDLFIDNNSIYAACGFSGFNSYSFTKSFADIRKTTKPQKMLSAFNYTGNNTSVYVKNGTAYLTYTPSGNYGLQLFDISGADSYNELGGAGGVEGTRVIVRNNYAYVAARYGGMKIFSLAQFPKPVLLSSQDGQIDSYDIDMKGDNCFLATTKNGVIIYNVSNPEKPIEIKRFPTEESASGIAVNDSIIFVAEGSKGIRILNYKNNTKNILYKNGLTYTRKVRLNDKYLYAIDDAKGLVVYDASDPYNLIEAGYYNLDKATAKNIFISDNIICVSQGYYGFSIFRNNLITSIEKQNEQIITSYQLEQNYPNPFNPTTVISYKVQAASHVTLKVFDVLGREAATLVNEYKQPGKYNCELSRRDAFGKNGELPSGIYFYQMQANGFVQTKKMVLMK